MTAALCVDPGAVISGPKVLGLDLSLTATGIAGPGWAETVKTRAQRTREQQVDFVHSRMDGLLDRIDAYLAGVDLAVIENLARRPGFDMTRQMAAFNWMVRRLLWKRGIPYALMDTTQLKVYAVGKGRRNGKRSGEAEQESAKSGTMQAVHAWFPWFTGDDNAADALVLMCAGRDWLGHPLVQLPEENRRVLRRVQWPTMPVLPGIAQQLASLDILAKGNAA